MLSGCASSTSKKSVQSENTTFHAPKVTKYDKDLSPHQLIGHTMAER